MSDYSEFARFTDTGIGDDRIILKLACGCFFETKRSLVAGLREHHRPQTDWLIRYAEKVHPCLKRGDG